MIKNKSQEMSFDILAVNLNMKFTMHLRSNSAEIVLDC